MLLMCFSVAPSRDPEQLGDPDVRAALGHRRQHLALAWRQRGERVVGRLPDHELGDHLRVEGRTAAGDAPQRIHELADVADAVLEQVADAAGPIGQQLRRVLPLDVLAEDEDRACPGPRRRASIAARRPSSRWLGRHPHVDDRHVRPVRSTTASTNDGPSPTFATTVPPDSSISRAIPSRMSAESSAMTTRSGEASTASMMHRRAPRAAPTDECEPAIAAVAARLYGATDARSNHSLGRHFKRSSSRARWS